MKFLFNSKGEYIANFVNDQLHSKTGQNIGHHLKEQEIFIDMNGRYLGEMVHDNRLMKKTNSPYQSTNFGSCGNFGNIGNYGSPGNYGSIGSVSGYEDIENIE